MKDMSFRANPIWSGVSWLAAVVGALLMTLTPVHAAGSAETLSGPRSGVPGAPDPGFPTTILFTIRPDYGEFIREVRPLPTGYHPARGTRRIYMALVRPGALDPAARASAPYAGPGARNDIVYDRATMDGRRGFAWTLLLLDHEYFHARHLAGTTTLPIPPHLSDEAVGHFYEATAWGFNVAEARAGRYQGLGEGEFREALDRYGEHYRALRGGMRQSQPEAWRMLRDLFVRPSSWLRRADLRSPAAVPSHPPDSGQAATIP